MIVCKVEVNSNACLFKVDAIALNLCELIAIFDSKFRSKINLFLLRSLFIFLIYVLLLQKYVSRLLDTIPAFYWPLFLPEANLFRNWKFIFLFFSNFNFCFRTLDFNRNLVYNIYSLRTADFFRDRKVNLRIFLSIAFLLTFSATPFPIYQPPHLSTPNYLPPPPNTQLGGLPI